MSEERAQPFRCLCLECEAEDSEARSPVVNAGIAAGVEDEEEAAARRQAATLLGTIERLLFGA